MPDIFKDKVELQLSVATRRLLPRRNESLELPFFHDTAEKAPGRRLQVSIIIDVLVKVESEAEAAAVVAKAEDTKALEEAVTTAASSVGVTVSGFTATPPVQGVQYVEDQGEGAGTSKGGTGAGGEEGEEDEAGIPQLSLKRVWLSNTPPKTPEMYTYTHPDAPPVHATHICMGTTEVACMAHVWVMCMGSVRLVNPCSGKLGI